jgi:hypothetical protein
MNEGYYKIILEDYIINGVIVQRENIYYYDTEKNLLTKEYYFGYIRPEYSQELPN